jgi:murein DD-endopeptidase MepM/ murein hydrolase activator NlpD
MALIVGAIGSYKDVRMQTRNCFFLIIAFYTLIFSSDPNAQMMDPETVWPLCGRITESPPSGWDESDGCPAERFGDPAHSDAPFSSTFGPRPLGSEDDRYDFHRGVDIATPSGTPLFAMTDGNVEIAGVHSSYSDPLIKLRHYRPGSTSCSGGGGCYHSYYLHVSDWVVSEDESVQKGQLIGYSGASGASGFQHVHFEVRDAPEFDVFSAWSRDAIHPFGALPYSVPNDTSIIIQNVDTSDPNAVTAGVVIDSNRYDLVSVELTLYDEGGEEISQPGNTAVNGYHLLPSFYDMESWNFEYSHKDSSAYPWEEFGAGGLYECPYHADHGASYSANVHMDAQAPASIFEGLFNGVHVVTSKYWLIAEHDYWLALEFQALQGPVACIEASTVFASGDVTTAEWGLCGTPPPNQPPIAVFTYDCNDLDCTFDGSGSADSDGVVTAWDWDFGDGFAASGPTSSHTFALEGTYDVSLLVTDDSGSSNMTSHSVTVTSPPVQSDITVMFSSNKKRNRITVKWAGATGNKVDIHRDGSMLVRTRNDGSWNDRNVSSGNTYLYKVCEQGSSTVCSTEESFTL